MVSKSKVRARHDAQPTRSADLYGPGDALPLPEVSEKNTDSVWALWSELVEGGGGKMAEKPGDYMGGDTVPATLTMALPELPKDDDS